MRKLYYIILVLFFIGIASSCSFAPLENFKNPADPGSESYQGYLVVDDPDRVVLHISDGDILTEPIINASKVLGVQAYHIQISIDKGFEDVVYERDNFESNRVELLDSDLPKTIGMLFWRVRAKLNDTWGNWSHVGTFFYLYSHTVYFDAQGGSTPVPAYKAITKGSQYGALPSVIRTGYVFDGWWSEPGGAGIQVASDIIVSTSTGHLVHAKWLPPYTVTFDSCGGSSPSPASKTVTYGHPYETLPTVTRTGYQFDGWWTGENGTGIQINTATVVSIKSDQKLYAKWEFIYNIRDIGPAGGYVFYDKGNYNDGWRYLEAAPSSYDYSYKVWGGYGTAVGGTGTAVGTGESNTQKIMAKFGNAEPYRGKTDYAAKVCADLVVTKGEVTYDDWFLPSTDELNLMHQNLKRNNLGGFSEDHYWSSSECDAYNAWFQSFISDGQYDSYRYGAISVRPVRAF